MIWLALLLVAALIALDKSLLPGAGILGVGALATIMPAKEATGITLALIIVADWTAIWAYRDHVDWKSLRRLLPNVIAGVVVGAGFIFVANDSVTRRVIGVIILAFVGWNVSAMIRSRMRKRKEEHPDAAAPKRTRAKGIVFGTLAGFTTMVANAGGPVTSMYFMTEGFPVRLFLGTTAWFYLIINLVKLPFSLGLGMLNTSQLPMIAAGVPVIVATVFLGRWASGRIKRSVFNALIVILTIITGLVLLI